MKINFTELELVAIKHALEIAARQYEHDEYAYANIPGHGRIAINFKDSKMLAKRLVKRIGDECPEAEAA